MLGEAATEGCPWDVEHVSNLALGVAVAEKCQRSSEVEILAGSAAVPPRCLGAGHAGQGSFSEQGNFKLTESPKQVQHQSALAGRRIDARIPYCDESDMELGQLVQDTEKVLKTASEPVELPDHDQIDLAAPGERQHPIEAWALFGRPRNAVINDLFNDAPRTLGRHGHQFLHLELHVLAPAHRGNSAIQNRTERLIRLYHVDASGPEALGLNAYHQQDPHQAAKVPVTTAGTC